MTELEALYKAYKNREYKKQKYNTSEYVNYSNAVLGQSIKLNPVQFKAGNSIHYMQDTVIGAFMYNAKVVGATSESVTIQPCGAAWKNRTITLARGSNTYAAKGWL